MSRSDLDALLAEIYANPRDRGLREVYADALQAVGDPRGELIALQLRATQWDERAMKLLDEHWREWIDPLAALTDRHRAVFDGGFLVSVRMIAFEPTLTAAEWQRIHTAPVWSTVRRLRIFVDKAKSAETRTNLRRIVELAPLGNLEMLYIPYELLVGTDTSRLRLRRLMIRIDESDSFDCDLASARGGEIFVEYQRYSTAPFELDIWRHAAIAGCETLSFDTYAMATSLHPRIATAIANAHPRPPHVIYDVRGEYLVALDGDTFTVRELDTEDPRDLAERARTFEHVLDRFTTVRFGIGTRDHVRWLVDGTCSDAHAWLADHADPSASGAADNDDL